MIECDQGVFDWCADGLVVPDDGVEGRHASHDAGPRPDGDAGAVIVQSELVSFAPLGLDIRPWVTTKASTGRAIHEM